ncbi:MAG: LysR family transcriptional regulator [Lawsonibacter sp.]|jgi:DNA-binding transcriptional LysR family regulator|nr:LysR family transcriptional regulator [Lawsonibacter sp.]
MNLKHLEYFITVAQMGSINRAAQALFISQPHLGKIIRDLEQSAGVPLFTRSNHGVTLTPEGIDFQRRAQRVMVELGDMFDRPGASGLQDVSLSVSMTKYSHIMESFIYTVLQHKDLPAYAHRLQEGDPLDVMEDVYNHRADVGVLHFSQGQRKDMNALFQDRQLIYRPLAHMTPHILISQQHPLLQEGRPVTLEALSGYGFVRYEGQFEDFTYDLLSQGRQFDPGANPRTVYIVTRASLLHLLAKTDFYSIGIQDFTMQQSSYQVVSVPIEDCRGQLEFGYILPAGIQLNSIAREFLNDLKDRLSK